MLSKLPSPAGPATAPVCKTGAQIIVDALLTRGVDTVFGYTGACVLPLLDRLYETPIRFVVPCHEQGGCHMADAYARASGKTGVVIATSGPGACNLVTGLACLIFTSSLRRMSGQWSRRAEASMRWKDCADSRTPCRFRTFAPEPGTCTMRYQRLKRSDRYANRVQPGIDPGVAPFQKGDQHVIEFA
jgi:hypothetical protein